MKIIQVVSLAALIGLIAALILSGGADIAIASPAQQGGYTYTLHLPIIQFNHPQDVIVPSRFLTRCSDDPVRGQLYRDLVSGTITIMNPLAEWAAEGCECGLYRARAQGRAFGGVVGLVVAIIGRIFTTIVNIVSNAITMIVQVWELANAERGDIDISCTDDAAGICWALAAIAALDDWAGGVITGFVLLLVGILSIYLAIFIVNSVREIMQPTGSDINQ